MKRFLLFQALALAWIFVVAGQDFNAFFTDATLRLDYVFSGNAARQEISLDELCREPRWYGKRQRLAEVPVEGNGQVTVRDHHSGEVIYRHSFSTLFQEWLATPEARQVSRSFQNVFLVPMPKDTVDVTVSLTGSRRQVMATFTHQVAPSDILIRQVGYDHVTPFTTVQQAADTTRCIHIAFIAEGYQQGEMGTFRADVDTAVQAIFAHEPFRSMRSRFNVVAVEAPSMDSGTSEPGAGRWKNTALGSAFNTFYSDRYLTTLRLKRLHDLLAGTPYEHIVVLVNCKTYGGGGILNSYNLTSTHHQHYKPVVVHEFGHSFAGLADEYAYASEESDQYWTDIEPWEHNITTLADFHGKWEKLIDTKTPIPTPLNPAKPQQIGFYEGAGYKMKGVYRPFQDCRMRTNSNPEFCAVCRRAILQVIDFYTR